MTEFHNLVHILCYLIESKILLIEDNFIFMTLDTNAITLHA